MNVKDRFLNAWNVFLNPERYDGSGRRSSFATEPFHVGDRSSFLIPVFSRIAVDVSSLYKFTHSWVDVDQIFIKNVNSRLDFILRNSPNIDQTVSHFFNDLVFYLLQEGTVGIVAVNKHYRANGDGFDVSNMRVGRIIDDGARKVRIRLYNDDPNVDNLVDLNLPKEEVAIITNPHHAIMNDTNSTLRRLVNKLNLLDSKDYLAISGKLDLLIQTPFAVKTDRLRKRAQNRVKDLVSQLQDNDLGIGYIDSTEKIVHLNRSYGGNILEEVTALTAQLYNQLGFTSSFLTGEVSETEITNYIVRILNPVVMAISESMTAAFIPMSAKTNPNKSQKIMAFRNPFIFTDMGTIIQAADTFTRNEIMSPNNMRSILGIRPVSNPEADKLRNRSIRPDLYNEEDVPSTRDDDNNPSSEDNQEGD